MKVYKELSKEGVIKRCKELVDNDDNNVIMLFINEMKDYVFFFVVVFNEKDKDDYEYMWKFNDRYCVYDDMVFIETDNFLYEVLLYMTRKDNVSFKKVYDTMKFIDENLDLIHFYMD
jgi:phosphoribosyl-ATP pyrophosphohydrolase